MTPNNLTLFKRDNRNVARVCEHYSAFSQAELAGYHSHEISTSQHGLHCIMPRYTCIIHCIVLKH